MKKMNFRKDYDLLQYCTAMPKQYFLIIRQRIIKCSGELLFEKKNQQIQNTILLFLQNDTFIDISQLIELKSLQSLNIDNTLCCTNKKNAISLFKIYNKI